MTKTSLCIAKVAHALVLIVVLMVPAAVAGAAGTAGVGQFLDRRSDPHWDVMRARGKPREIDFETDEGTWMSIDISPDGRWIVFDMLGHIYRVNAAGGRAECITQSSGVALNYHPAVSPDGRHIAFVSDRAGQAGLWLMDLDGRNTRLIFSDPTTKIVAPTWFPDGRAIAAVREFPTYSMHRRSQRIWMFPVDDAVQAPRELVGSASGMAALWPSISPDGKSLYYMQSTFANQLHGNEDFQAIRKLDLATGQVTTVSADKALSRYHEGDRAELAPELSPDGRWLAFVRRLPGAMYSFKGHTVRGRSALWLRDLHSGAERILMDPVTFDMQNAHAMKNLRVVPGYSWAGDSQSLVIWREGKIQRVGLDGVVAQVPFVARVHRVASEQTRWRHGYDDSTLRISAIRWPAFSSSHNAIVFEAAAQIWIQSKDRKSQAKALVSWSPERALYMPAVSPDGERVVYTTWNDLRLGSVEACQIAPCEPGTLSREPARYLYPAWHPDGRSVYVIRSRGADSQRLAANTEAISYDLVRLGEGGETLIKANVGAEPFTVGPNGRIYQLSVSRPGNAQQYLEHGIPMPPSQSVLSSFAVEAPLSVVQHIAFPSATRAAISPRGDSVMYSEEGEILLAPARRQMAEYAETESFRWLGEESPQPIIKENPLHQVRAISSGGGHDARWVDANRLMYAAGATVALHDEATGSTEIIPVRAALQKYRPAADRTIALTGARIVTLRGDEVLESADLVVRGTRILCVGVCDTSVAEKRVSLQGKTIVPGFIDVHAHGGSWGMGALPQQVYFNASYLAHGVTTTLDPSAVDDTVFPLAELVEAGRVVGPRMFSTGHALEIMAPQFGPHTYAQALARAQEVRDWGAHSLKVFLSPRRDQRQMYVEAARKLGLAATSEGSDMYYDVATTLDGSTGFEHPMQYLILYRDAIEFFARSGVVYSPTLNVESASLWSEDFRQSRANVWADPKLQRFVPYQRLMMDINFAVRPKSEYTFPFLAEGVAAIRRAGGVAAIGGHGELWGRDSQWEMLNYAEAQTPLEVLTMASRGGAQRLGLETALGSLEVGKIADLVVLGANPLEDIANVGSVEQVMKGGVLYRADSLDEAWPAERPFGTPAWYRSDVYRNDVYSADPPQGR